MMFIEWLLEEKKKLSLFWKFDFSFWDTQPGLHKCLLDAAA